MRLMAGHSRPFGASPTVPSVLQPNPSSSRTCTSHSAPVAVAPPTRYSLRPSSVAAKAEPRRAHGAAPKVGISAHERASRSRIQSSLLSPVSVMPPKRNRRERTVQSACPLRGAGHGWVVRSLGWNHFHCSALSTVAEEVSWLSL